MKLRTGAVRARCVSARRAALTTALDMLPRAGEECAVKGLTLCCIFVRRVKLPTIQIS